MKSRMDPHSGIKRRALKGTSRVGTSPPCYGKRFNALSSVCQRCYDKSRCRGKCGWKDPLPSPKEELKTLDLEKVVKARVAEISDLREERNRLRYLAKDSMFALRDLIAVVRHNHGVIKTDMDPGLVANLAGFSDSPSRRILSTDMLKHLVDGIDADRAVIKKSEALVEKISKE